jgi:hypothetical protein
MNDFLRRFVSETEIQHGGHLRTPAELFQRKSSADELLDTAVLSGYSVSDILSGKATEADIDPKVLEAFHRQFPNVGNFVDFVHSHEGDSSALNGIVSGVKGKLFELEYVHWLNEGHLPDGAIAELASSPTQVGWDILIKDASGHPIDHLQLKATESLSYIREALAAHPEIDVVATHEAFQHLDGTGLDDHVTVSDFSNEHLTEHVQAGIHAAEMSPEFELPLLAFGIIALQSYLRHRKGQLSVEEAIRSSLRRGSRTLICRAATHASILISHEPLFGLPTSVLTRMAFGRYDAHHNSLHFIESLVVALRANRINLQEYCRAV